MSEVETLKPPGLTAEQMLMADRHEIATLHDLEIKDQPTELSTEQAQVQDEAFGKPQEVVARIREELSGKYPQDAFSRADKDLSRLEPGQTEALLRPQSQFEADVVDRAALATFNRAQAVLQAVAVAHEFKTDGLSKEQELEQALKNAQHRVYTSPDNGAPVLAERQLDLPGGTIYEIDVHPVGSTETRDTQVLFVRK